MVLGAWSRGIAKRDLFDWFPRVVFMISSQSNDAHQKYRNWGVVVECSQEGSESKYKWPCEL